MRDTKSIATLLLLVGWGAVATLEAAPTMRRIPSGMWMQPFPPKGEEASRKVSAFEMDTDLVSESQYLNFVKANPGWQRSRVSRLMADERYLSHWEADLRLGTRVLPDQPVTHVSWFAARAYCEAQGKRLPNIHEWEYVALASPTAADGTKDPAHKATLVTWYSRPAWNPLPTLRTQAKPNHYGIHDMHVLVWEWVEDFGSVLLSTENRSSSGQDRSEFCAGGSLSAKDVENYPAFMRMAFRSSLKGNFSLHNLGFRCVK